MELLLTDNEQSRKKESNLSVHSKLNLDQIITPNSVFKKNSALETPTFNKPKNGSKSFSVENTLNFDNSASSALNQLQK